MSLAIEDQLQVLQRFVNQFPADLAAVHAALSQPMPEPAQRFLIGALNYALDMLDIVPDNKKGIGMADDAIVLRLAAKLARQEGASGPVIDALATDANLVTVLFEDLAAPLEKLVATFADREVRGRTASNILAHKDTRVMWDADVTREVKRLKPLPIGGGADPARAVADLRGNLAATLVRAKLT